MLDREFCRMYRIPRQIIDEMYQIALQELDDRSAAYFAVHGCIRRAIYKNNDAIIFRDFYRLSPEAVERMTNKVLPFVRESE